MPFLGKELNMEAQEYLDKNYPKEKRGEITGLYISDKNLTGDLDLSDFPQLTHLSCANNKLTSLNLENNIDLTGLSCVNNKFTDFSFLLQLKPEKL
jgi:Leucine-rich repeat (LRR) protein